MKKAHRSILLAVLLILGMIVSPPVMAAEYTLTGYQEVNILDTKKDIFDNVYNLTFDKSNEDQAIMLIHFKVPMDHQVDFTIHYGAGNSVSGSASTAWNTSLLPLHTTTSSITFNGETKEYSYLDTNPEFDYYLSGYARSNENNETGIIVYNAGYGSFDNDLSVFMPVAQLPANLIYRVDLSCDAPFDVDISYGTASEVAATVSKDPIQVALEWVNIALSLGSTLLGFVLMLIGLIKFFFVDNLLLIIALWISVTMAVSATQSRNIFQFYHKFFKYQRTLLMFIIDLWNYLIQIISSFRGIFRI